MLLGAGMSERFGTENKLLADIGGDPLIRKVVSEVIDSGIAEVVVVTGWDKGFQATLNQRQIAHINTAENKSLYLQCGDNADRLAIVDAAEFVVAGVGN